MINFRLGQIGDDRDFIGGSRSGHLVEKFYDFDAGRRGIIADEKAGVFRTAAFYLARLFLESGVKFSQRGGGVC